MFSIQMLAVVQAETPEHLIGKVIACITTLIMCAQPFGQLIYGLLFERIGASVIIVCTGVVRLVFEDGFSSDLPYEQYSRQFRGLIAAHGKIETIHYKPENEAELRGILQTERMIPAAKKRTPRRKKPATR